jgi:hypothetical protein
MLPPLSFIFEGREPELHDVPTIAKWKPADWTFADAATEAWTLADLATKDR